MTLTEAQTSVDNWIKTYGVRYFNELTNTAILMEEVGELARIMARTYGEQSFKKTDTNINLADEMADVLFVLICIANQTGTNLDEALVKNLEKKNQSRCNEAYRKRKINTKMIKIGVIGGAGYTGGELLRILIFHPLVEIVFVHSNSNAGNFIADVHTDLLGDTDLKFSESYFSSIDVLFMCVGHGESKKFFDQNPDFLNHSTLKIIDLSQDFRPETNGFFYGLPELKRETIKKASKIANPGCYATAIQLALLPLASQKKIKNDIYICATTGSTGAGQTLSATSQFSWRNNNLSSYKSFEHQHLKEIGQSLKQLQPDFEQEINFIPYRGAFARGIFASVYLDTTLNLNDVTNLYKTYYHSHPFTHIAEKNIDLKQVINTNKCILFLEKHGNKLLITSIIDNLTKGASGQAVQNMNLIFGLDEKTGLGLKGIGF